jgi:hypothetical protein
MDTHGYVYAFAHPPNGWVKIGMTEKDDTERCWARIDHYIKQHRLPDQGWEFVGFIATHKARELETRLHRSLKKFRVTLEGERTELFQCSIGVYFAALEHLNDFIDQSQSTGERTAPSESEDQRIAREARELRREQARLRKQIDDEWLLKGRAHSMWKWERAQEFSRRWAEHPIEKARQAREEAEHAERKREIAKQQAAAEAARAEWKREIAKLQAAAEAAEADLRVATEAAEADLRAATRRAEERKRAEEGELRLQEREARLRNSIWFKLGSWARRTTTPSGLTAQQFSELAEKQRLERSAKQPLEAALAPSAEVELAEKKRLAESARRKLDAARANPPIAPLPQPVADAVAALVNLGYGQPHKAALPRPIADAVAALVNLGYGQPQASAAIAAALQTAGEQAPVTQLIKLGLREIAR